MNTRSNRVVGLAVATLSCVVLTLTAAPAAVKASVGEIHRVYVESNDATSNSIMVFQQRDTGVLKWNGTVATGGAGNGGALGAGALAVGENGTLLFAVNAGSNTLSVFQISPTGGLSLVQQVWSEGISPISVTTSGNVVYVLNLGGTSNVAGFTWTAGSGLTPIPSDVWGLSAPSPNPAQVGFTRNGKELVVTERGTNLLDVFSINASGAITSVATHPETVENRVPAQRRSQFAKVWGLHAPDMSCAVPLGTFAGGFFEPFTGPKEPRCWFWTRSLGAGATRP